jgi:ribosomal protein L24E
MHKCNYCGKSINKPYSEFFDLVYCSGDCEFNDGWTKCDYCGDTIHPELTQALVEDEGTFCGEHCKHEHNNLIREV